jgi:glycosyltransferase involved in cell wall biosynthesis
MRVLMVCTEYPPMPGGIGRYAANLVRELQKSGLEVYVACDDKGNGQYPAISPTNNLNSQILLRIVDDLRPDIVHVQFEPGLYGLRLDISNPNRSMTHIDQFYVNCKVPIVTTFHSIYNLKQWMRNAVLLKWTGRTGRIGMPARTAVKAWKYFLNYKAFSNLSKQKLMLSKGGIVFSQYMHDLLGGGKIIYLGAEPALLTRPSKEEAKAFFSLPLKEERKIALAVGFKTASKGWDVLQKMPIPNGWTMVVNSSKGYYNRENFELNLNKGSNIIDLQRGLLSEEDLSMLFYAADAVILPYKITSNSAVMFDALAHGLPFVATNLEFFNEFSRMGLGISVKRNPSDFSEGLKILHKKYFKYSSAVEQFKYKLKWNHIAKQHIELYHSVSKKEIPVRGL